MFSFSGNNGGVFAMLVGADGRSISDIVTLLEVLLPRYPASGKDVSRGTLDLGLPD
jgi:hypothetical protein